MQTHFLRPGQRRSTDRAKSKAIKAQQKIQEKEANLHALVENLDGLVWSIDRNMRYLIINNALRKKIKEVIGVEARPGDKMLDVLAILDPTKTKEWKKFYQAAFRGESQRITEKFIVDGQPVYFEISINPIHKDGSVTGLSCFAREVTDKISYERKLKASEVRFRSLIENSTDIIVVLNEEGQIIYGSPSIEKHFGVHQHEYDGTSAFGFIHPDHINKILKQFTNLLKKPGKSVFVQTIARRMDGLQIWVEGMATNLLKKEGINGIVCNFRDVTDRVKAAEATQQNEFKFRTLIENSSDLILMVDAEGKFSYGSPSVRKMLGYTRKDYLKKSLFTFIHPDSVTEAQEALENLYKNPGKPFTIYLKLIHKSGKEIMVEGIATNLLHVPGVNALVGNFRDIGERKRAEKMVQELRHQLMEEKIFRQKEIMQAAIDAQEKEREEIGRELHDNVTQILTTARLCLSCVDDQLHDPGDMIQRSSNIIAGAIEEIRKLSKSMTQSYHKEVGLQLSLEDLVDSVRLTNPFTIALQYALKNENRLDDKLKMTLFRIVQEQLNNILKHAQASAVEIELKENADELTLSISDNGKGFNVREKRNGIGISNIINRAEIFNGRVTINSSPGNGCQMIIHFNSLSARG